MSRDGDERTDVPDPEVVPVAQRRPFTASEKLRIMAERLGEMVGVSEACRVLGVPRSSLHSGPEAHLSIADEWWSRHSLSGSW
jgi:transposase-like protein